MCFFGGTRALCCDPPHTYNDNYVTDFKNKLLSFADDHTCPVSQLHGQIHAKTKRGDEAEDVAPEGNFAPEGKSSSTFEVEHSVQDRKVVARDFKSLGGYSTLHLLQAALPLGTQLNSLLIEAYNDIIGSKINVRAPRDLQAAIDNDPYDDPPSALAAMFCGWKKSSQLLKDPDETAEVCVNPPNDSNLDRAKPDSSDEPPVYERRKRGLESFEDLRGETDFPFDYTKRDLENVTRRTFIEDNSATIRDPDWAPTTGAIMHAVVNDDLPLLYMQRIRYRAQERNNEDTILEVAFDIRGRPDLQETTPEIQEGIWRADIFAVFHFHVFGFAHVDDGPDIPLIPYFHVYHGQRVAPDRRQNPQYVVESRETVSLVLEISTPRGTQMGNTLTCVSLPAGSGRSVSSRAKPSYQSARL